MQGAVGCKLLNRSINNFWTLFLCPKVMDFFDKIRGGGEVRPLFHNFGTLFSLTEQHFFEKSFP